MDIKYFLKYELKYIPKNILKGINNLIKWTPLIWKDRDYDYTYLLKVLNFKISRMSNYARTKGHLVNSNKYAKQMEYASFLIERILKDEYFPEEQKAFDDKYGELNMETYPSDKEGYQRVEFTYSKAKDQKQADKEMFNLTDKKWKEQQKDYKRLFKHMNRYIQKWWD